MPAPADDALTVVTALTGPIATVMQDAAEALASVVAELAPMVSVWRRLLREHAPDPDGQCRACTQGGTGLPGAVWPCLPYTIAHLAFQYIR